MFSPINFRVGWFLAWRQIRRSSIWTTGLIIFVMLLTFLNLVVVTGILVGLVEGINENYRKQYIGDTQISALDTKDYIENAPSVAAFVKTLPQVAQVSARYQKGGVVEANYKTKTDERDKGESISATVFGINPEVEDTLTGLSHFVVEGNYLQSGDYDQVLIGSQLLAKYAFGSLPGQTPLTNIGPGSKIRLTVNGSQREMTVKGVVKSKVDYLSMGLFMTDTQARALLGRDDNNVSQIAIRLTPGTDASAFRDLLVRSGVGQFGKVQTFEDAIPNGVADIKKTFAMLGNGISSIGLVVASITIFIVIFINALTRRKFIGILKGIGISPQAIEIAYILQSLFYALCGSAIGLLVLYGFLVPYIAANPIDFPFADGILDAPLGSTLIRMGLLVFATLIAGYIPARMIVKKNTLDSILGRN